MVEIFGHNFEHIIVLREVGNPVYMYVVMTEDGYYINTPSLGANVFKTATSIYATDDLDSIIIIPESELPEGAEILGGITRPEPEIKTV